MTSKQLRTQLREAEEKLQLAVNDANRLAAEVARLRFGNSSTRVLELEMRCSRALRFPKGTPAEVRWEEAKALLKIAGVRYYSDRISEGWSLKPWGKLEPPLRKALDFLGERKITPGNPKSPLPSKRAPSVRYHFVEVRIY